MKNHFKLLTVLCIIFTLLLVGCGESKIEIITSQPSVTLYDTEVLEHDFTQYFTITKKDVKVEVDVKSCLDTSKLKAEAGTYKVTCTYEEVSKDLEVIVKEHVRTVTVSKTEISLYTDEVADHDFKQYFNVKEDGKDVTVTDAFIDAAAVTTTVGTYTVTCTFHDEVKTLKVVVKEHVRGVTATKPTVTLFDIEVEDFDFKDCFTITEDGNEVAVTDAFINATAVTTTPGTYEVTCTYFDQTAKVTVTVNASVYELNTDVTEVTLLDKDVATYNFKELFTLLCNDTEVELKDEYITSTVEGKEGTYTYTVNYKGVTKTITVNVFAPVNIEIKTASKLTAIYKEYVKYFDFTKLFMVTVDGKYVLVDADDIDTSKLTDCVVGQEYDVTLTYVDGASKATATVKVKIVERETVTITPTNIEVFPNQYVDVYSLFTIHIGEEQISSTNGMLSGEINYSKPGSYNITLFYGMDYATATVTIKDGIKLDYKTSSTIEILKGTNTDTYDFAADFVLVINGEEAKTINDRFIKKENVDFNTLGKQTVTVEIPYTTVNGEVVVTKTITYDVVAVQYELTIKEDLIIFDAGTTGLDVLKNIELTINGRKQGFTNDVAWEDSITTVYYIASDPIDFSSKETQTVTIELYVYGYEKDPIIATFAVKQESAINIEQKTNYIFTTDTLDLNDLFTITDGEAEVEVLDEYIDGYINPLLSEEYVITVTYGGETERFTIYVIDRAFISTFKTNMRTIPQYDYDENDNEIALPTTRLKDLVINEDGTMSVNGTTTNISKFLSLYDFSFNLGTFEYRLTRLDNGIMLVNPINDSKISFTDNLRPIVYFDVDMYDLASYMMINRSNHYVLTDKYTTYSFDCIKLKNKETNEIRWFGLRTELVEKTSSDSIYSVIGGVINFKEDVSTEVDYVGSFVFYGVTYEYKMTSANEAKIQVNKEEKKFANKTFTGYINGIEGTLSFNEYEGVTFTVLGREVFSYSSYEINNMTNGGYDYAKNTVLVYEYDLNHEMSYSFKLDLDNNTFTCSDKNDLFGRFEDDKMFFFFDGFGNGIANFNKSSYTKTSFRYYISSGLITIYFENTPSNFAYGREALFVLDVFNNRITCINSSSDDLMEHIFLRENIIEGCDVTLTNNVIGQTTAEEGFDLICSMFSVRADYGQLTIDQIKGFVDVSHVSFDKAGYYEITFSYTIDGQEVTKVYTIEILESIYKDNILVGEYTKSVASSKYQLIIDEYGRVKFTISRDVYEGMIHINDDNTFEAVVSLEGKDDITLTGSLVVDGILTINGVYANGSTFDDAVTKGSVQKAGNRKDKPAYYIFEISYIDTVVYFVSDNEYKLGVQTTLDKDMIVAGDVFTFTFNGKEVTLKLDRWGYTYNGLVGPDKYVGTYTNEELGTLVIDGFGNATYNGTEATYESKTDNVIIISIDNKMFEVDTTAKTFKAYEAVVDALTGLTFKGSFDYLDWGGGEYTIDTTFEFQDDGQVIVKCVIYYFDGSFSPSYGSESGKTGTYTIDGNKVVVKVGGETFEFDVNSDYTTLTTTSTTVGYYDDGYFEVGQKFTKK